MRYIAFLHTIMEHDPEAVIRKEEWEAFLHAEQPHSFLQSWDWGETNAQGGSKIFRIGMRRGSDLVAVALLIKISARRGSFILIPHGPVIARSENKSNVTRTILARATAIATVEGCVFLRVCPLAHDTPENKAIYRSMGFRGAPIHMHPELAWMLDITKPEDQLLKEMRKTTRYLIRKLDAGGVEIMQSANPDDIEQFWPVYEATAKRQRFTVFKKSDLRKEFELFAADQGLPPARAGGAQAGALFFFGKHDGVIVAAAVIIFYNGQAFYHHSGSFSDASGSNVSYLLQWRVIQEAKRRGCTLYNFWGISPENKPRHPWAGLSLFKKGFGGFVEEYLHAMDMPLSRKYIINYAVETARRLKRGF